MLLVVLVGLPSGRGFVVVSATSCSVANFEICPSFSLTFFMSSGLEKSVEAVVLDATALPVVVVVVVVIVPLPPLQLVAEGAGLKEEEAELTGEGSMDEAESMQRAESRELIEPSRLLLLLVVVHGVVVVSDWTCAFIHGCWRHFAAVRRFLGGGEGEGVREK